MSYKYARVLFSGLRSSPIDPERQAELQSRGFTSRNLNKMIARNINFFSKYKFEKTLPFLSGLDDIYNANYSGIIFELITGDLYIQDSGLSNISGKMEVSGIQYGTFRNKFFSKLKFREGEEIYPINNNITFNPTKNLKIDFPSGYDDPLDPEYLKRKDPTGYIRWNSLTAPEPFSITKPYLFRQKIWDVIYTGFAEFRDYFYDPINQSVTFYKIFPYSVSGAEWPTYNLTVITKDGEVSGGLYPPGSFVLNKYLASKSGYIEETGRYLVSGIIPHYKLLRTGLSGFGLITGKLTGIVQPENSGYIRISGLQEGDPLEPTYQFTHIGYQNSTGILNYNSPQNDDYIKIQNDLLDNFVYTFSYHSDVEVFGPPSHFNSINILNDIINSGSGIYGIYSEITQNNKLKIKSSISGSSGNHIRITSIGSSTKPSMENQEYLVGGITYYEPIVASGKYKAYLNSVNLYATGIYSAEFKDTIYSTVTGKIGYKSFTGSWDIYQQDGAGGFVSVKENNYQELSKEQIKSLPTELKFGPNNNYILKITYENNTVSSLPDKARLEIFMNNALKTGLNIQGDKNYGI